MNQTIWNRINRTWQSVFDGTFITEEILVTVDDFEYGWLTMTLSTHKGQKIIIDMSDVYSPLCNLREMISGWSVMEGVMEIMIDCEGYKVMIGMKPTGGYDKQNKDYYGILTCYTLGEDDEDVDNSLVALVNMGRVAESIYTALKTTILRSRALLEDPEMWEEHDIREEYLDGTLHPKTYRKELFNRYLRIPFLDPAHPATPND